MVLKPAKDDKPHVLCSGNTTTGHPEQLPHPGELTSPSGPGAGVTKECHSTQNSPSQATPHLGDLQVPDVELEGPDGCFAQDHGLVAALHLQGHRDMFRASPAARCAPGAG